MDIYKYNMDIMTDSYFIDRKKVITDLFVIEMRDIYVHIQIYTQDCYFVKKSFDNIHGMTYITKTF